MSSPQVNGEMPPRRSATLEHIHSYPIVHDSFETAKRHPVGQKTMEIGVSVYQTLAGRFPPSLLRRLMPWLEKADSMGNMVLDKFDEKAPIAKRPTNEVVEGVKGLAALPLHVTISVKDHVLQTYDAEHQRAGGQGVVTSGTAMVNTTGTLASQLYGTLASFMSRTRATAQKNHDDMGNSHGQANGNGNNGAAH